MKGQLQADFPVVVFPDRWDTEADLKQLLVSYGREDTS